MFAPRFSRNMAMRRASFVSAGGVLCVLRPVERVATFAALLFVATFAGGGFVVLVRDGLCCARGLGGLAVAAAVFDMIILVAMTAEVPAPARARGGPLDCAALPGDDRLIAFD